jgi:replicative DNA helicase
MSKKELTESQKEMIETAKKIKDYKMIAEANIVSIFWKSPNLMYDHDEISLDSFHENMYKVYWQIANDIVINEKKEKLDEITVDFYLDKHPKLKDKYNEYGGWQEIETMKEYVDVANLNGYILDLHKWDSVFNLLKKGFPVKSKLSNFADMSIEEIYDGYETQINHIFINAETEIKSYDISYGLYDLIDDFDEGEAIGLPFHNMPILNHLTGGCSLGNITLIGGVSGAGKTAMVRDVHFPSIIENDEKVVVMLNEEGLKKWQREMLVWVANNIYQEDVPKHKVRDGKYTPEFKQLLRKCADWLIEKKDNRQITVIELQHYNTKKAVKIIKKYASLGVDFFVLDTFKPDKGSNVNDVRGNMNQNMVEIYDTIKDSVKNVHIIPTFQLNKASNLQRYFTQYNIGEAKGIVDVASTCIMIRTMFKDEYPGGARELAVYNLDENNDKIPVEIDENKKYQIIFVVKNREGSTNEFQIVAERDLARNTIKEVGITNVPHDT